MSLSQFPAAMSRLSRAVLGAASAIRDVQGATGPLPLALLDRVQATLFEAKDASYDALGEGSKAPVPAEKLMGDMGGPATLAEFQTLVQGIEAKANTWHQLLDGQLATLAGSDLLAVASVMRDGRSAQIIQRTPFLPLDQSDALRQSTALAELLAAFEAVGA